MMLDEETTIFTTMIQEGGTSEDPFIWWVAPFCDRQCTFISSILLANPVSIVRLIITTTLLAFS